MTFDNLFKALVRAQATAKAAELDGNNKHHNYRYARAESLIQEGRATLSACGLALLVMSVDLILGSIDVTDYKTGEVHSVPRAIVRATYRLAHESGEWIDYTRDWIAIEQKGRPLDKAAGGALTTALGYAIRDVLLLPRDDEYADMDRRDDRSFVPGQAGLVATARNDEPAPDSDRRERAHETDERAAIKDEAAGDGENEWESLIAAIKKGESIGAKLEKSSLPIASRVALAAISRAWKAETPDAVAKINAEVRANLDLSSELRALAETEIKAAFRAAEDRGRRLAKAEDRGLEKAS